MDYGQEEVDLFSAIALLTSSREIEAFLADLCTPAEVKAFVERWRVCQLLDRDASSYREIRESTGASLTTIGRVARFLRNEKHGGYRNLLKKIKQEK
ncbi:MAG: transcriptional regulator [Holosporales bacterium]|jgi:TrpR-related protein YerC/YecD|nr:transcriptional regulator [Holosporales bacterium]